MKNLKVISTIKCEFGREISDERYIFETDLLNFMDNSFRSEYDKFCNEVYNNNFLDRHQALNNYNEYLKKCEEKYYLVQEDIKNEN